MESPKMLPQKDLKLKTNEGYVFIDLCDIIRCEADRNHTLLYTTLQENHFRLTIKFSEFENIFPLNNCMFRCHRSHIVNLKHLIQFKEKGRILVTIKGDVPITEPNIKEFKEFWCKG
jgi:two-component system LytT family response regulator